MGGSTQLQNCWSKTHAWIQELCNSSSSSRTLNVKFGGSLGSQGGVCIRKKKQTAFCVLIGKSLIRATSFVSNENPKPYSVSTISAPSLSSNQKFHEIMHISWLGSHTIFQNFLHRVFHVISNICGLWNNFPFQNGFYMTCCCLIISWAQSFQSHYYWDFALQKANAKTNITRSIRVPLIHLYALQICFLDL